MSTIYALLGLMAVVLLLLSGLVLYVVVSNLKLNRAVIQLCRLNQPKDNKPDCIKEGLCKCKTDSK